MLTKEMFEQALEETEKEMQREERLRVDDAKDTNEHRCSYQLGSRRCILFVDHKGYHVCPSTPPDSEHFALCPPFFEADETKELEHLKLGQDEQSDVNAGNEHRCEKAYAKSTLWPDRVVRCVLAKDHKGDHLSPPKQVNAGGHDLEKWS